MPKLSGLALDSDTNTLYATSCETKRSESGETCQGGVYVIELDNNYAVHQTWAIPFYDKISDTESKEDVESIAIGPNKQIYIGFETSHTVNTISGDPSTECAYYNQFTLSFSGNPAGTDDGLEGIDFYQNRFCFGVSEQHPIDVILYDLSGGTRIFQTELPEFATSGAITDIAVLEISDKHELWVLDSAACEIKRYQIGATDLKYVASIILPNVIKKNKPDALVLDAKNGMIYIGCAGYGSVATSKIYGMKISQVTQASVIDDELAGILLNPVEPQELYENADSLPNLKGGKRGVLVTLPNAVYHNFQCQAVTRIVGSNGQLKNFYIQPEVRTITGATTFFYPEDLGYLNRHIELVNETAEFVGIKILDGKTTYVTSKGLSVQSPVVLQPKNDFQVLYALNNFKEEDGDVFYIKYGERFVASEDVYPSGTTLALTATPGGYRTLSVKLNNQVIDLSELPYEFTLDKASGIVANYNDWDGKFNVAFSGTGAVAGEEFNVIYSGEPISTNTRIDDGEVVTLSATTIPERIVEIMVNDEAIELVEGAYDLTINGDKNIVVEFGAPKFTLSESLSGYNEASGDSWSVTVDDEDITLPANLRSGTCVTVNASAGDGRMVTLQYIGDVSGEHTVELIDDELTFHMHENVLLKPTFTDLPPEAYPVTFDLPED